MQKDDPGFVLQGHIMSVVTQHISKYYCIYYIYWTIKH